HRCRSIRRAPLSAPRRGPSSYTRTTRARPAPRPPARSLAWTPPFDLTTSAPAKGEAGYTGPGGRSRGIGSGTDTGGRSSASDREVSARGDFDEGAGGSRAAEADQGVGLLGEHAGPADRPEGQGSAVERREQRSRADGVAQPGGGIAPNLEPV